MAGTYSPFVPYVVLDDNGIIVSGAKIYTYAAGSTTPIATYNNADLDVSHQNSNPVICDSAGRCTLFLVPGLSYKYIAKNAADVLLWTRDDINTVPGSSGSIDLLGTVAVAVTANTPVYLADGTGGTVSGQWYKTDATNAYSSTLPGNVGIAIADIAAGASGSIRIEGRITGLAGLTIGATYYASGTAGQLTSSAPTLARPIGTADSSTSLILSQFTAQQVASAAQGGVIAASGAQTLHPNFTFDSTTAQLFMVPPTFKPGTSGSAGTSTPVVGTINTDATAHTTSVAGTPADLSTFTIPANTLSANGKGIRVTVFGKYAATGNNKKIKFYWNGTAIFDSGNKGENNTGWQCIFLITRTGASLQSHRGTFFCGGAILNSNASSPLTSIEGIIGDNLNADTTTAIVIKTEATDAVLAGGTTQLSWMVEVIG